MNKNVNNKKAIITDGSVLFDKFDNGALFELYNKSTGNSIHTFYKDTTNEYIYFTDESVINELKKRNLNLHKADSGININIEPIPAVFQED